MNRPRIVRDPDILGGASRIEGTRIRPAMVRSYDYDVAVIRDQYPHLTYAQINAAIEYELHWSQRLRRWLSLNTAPLRYQVAAWLLGTDAETLRDDVG
jgi:uncharacterized protein (DUF433 family)